MIDGDQGNQVRAGHELQSPGAQSGVMAGVMAYLVQDRALEQVGGGDRRVAGSFDVPASDSRPPAAAKKAVSGSSCEPAISYTSLPVLVGLLRLISFSS